MGFEVDSIDDVVADLRSRGVEFEPFDIAGFEVENDIVAVPDNYASKGSGERGAFFRDSEGNLLAIAQATRCRQRAILPRPAAWLRDDRHVELTRVQHRH